MTIKKLNLVLLTAVILSLCSCNDKQNTGTKSSNEAVTRDVFAMDTYMNLKVYSDDAETVLNEAEERIYQLEKELSVTSENSDVWVLDHNKNADISDDTARIIRKAVDIGSMTNGALDITLYPLVREWGFTTGEYSIPDKKRIDELLKNVGYERIKLNGNKAELSENAEIDLGALAKGYTGDEVIDIMKSHGVSSAIVSLGGNVQALGSKPDGSSWKVAVRDPFSPEKDMCVVEISGKAVITSGNYERFFTGDDGRNYWHILDPKDGFPADNGIVSATVIGDNGLECDALSTAFFVMGLDKIKEYLADNPENDVILVTDDRKIYYSSGLSDKFTNISDMPAEVTAID